jgi:hypothetical protein
LLILKRKGRANLLAISVAHQGCLEQCHELTATRSTPAQEEKAHLVWLASILSADHAASRRNRVMPIFKKEKTYSYFVLYLLFIFNKKRVLLFGILFDSVLFIGFLFFVALK